MHDTLIDYVFGTSSHVCYAEADYMNGKALTPQQADQLRMVLYRWEFNMKTGTVHEKALDRVVRVCTRMHICMLKKYENCEKPLTVW